MIHLGNGLRMNTLKFPNKICIADESRQFSFRQFNEQVNRLANGLIGLGVKSNDKIAIYARNSIEYMEVFHACAKIGACLVTLNCWLRPNELIKLINRSDAVLLILDEELQENFVSIASKLSGPSARSVIIMGKPEKPNWKSYDRIISDSSDLEPQAEVKAEGRYWMLYTSGTTGEPKGAVRSHKRVIENCLFTSLEFEFCRDESFLAISPFFHGVTFLPLMILLLGGTLFVLRKFDPDKALDIIEKHQITASFMVPTMLDMLLGSAKLESTCFDSLKILITGAAPLPTQVKKRILDILGPVLFEYYGISETGFLTVLHPEDQFRKTRCCGQPSFGIELDVRDENGKSLPPGEIGELVSRSDGCFDEYYKEPEKTAEALQDGWFYSGDLGMRDEENYFYIVDRKTDMIISGGENIYPREIEDVLRFHPHIEDCSVYGIPDERWGESVMASVVLKANVGMSEKEIIDYCNKHLAGFKCPKMVEFRNDLPRTASGKIMKRALRDVHWKDKTQRV